MKENPVSRAKYTYWKSLIAIAGDSGLPVEEWCRKNCISIKTYRHFEGVLRRQAARNAGLEKEAARPTAGRADASETTENYDVEDLPMKKDGTNGMRNRSAERNLESNPAEEVPEGENADCGGPHLQTGQPHPNETDHRNGSAPGFEVKAIRGTPLVEIPLLSGADLEALVENQPPIAADEQTEVGREEGKKENKKEEKGGNGVPKRKRMARKAGPDAGSDDKMSDNRKVEEPSLVIKSGKIEMSFFGRITEDAVRAALKAVDADA